LTTSTEAVENPVFRQKLNECFTKFSHLDQDLQEEIEKQNEGKSYLLPVK
jgi:hypothetical protein